MNSTVLPGLICAATLVILAIIVLIYALHRVIRPVQRTKGVQPPAPSRPSVLTRVASTPLAKLAPRISAPKPAANQPYARISHLLTAAEGDFFSTLQQAAPAGFHLFAQVRLANLVEVQRWARRDKSHWWRIQAKCVDFVLCESHSFAPRLVIELDDSSHDRADRRERDAFVDDVLASAGIPILHVRWQRNYDSHTLVHQIAVALGTAMPSVAAPAPPVAVALAAAPSSHVAPSAPHPSPAQPTPTRHICGQCQAELREAAKFCSNCGAITA